MLVSNFNNSGNLQGTGTTIVQVSPAGMLTLFAQISASSLPGTCPGGIGLTTALSILPGGWVVVGSLPTTDGHRRDGAGRLPDRARQPGQGRETISGARHQRPVGHDRGQRRAAVASCSSPTCSTGRSPRTAAWSTGARCSTAAGADLGEPPARGMLAVTTIGSGFAERTDPAALVVGPTGVGLGFNGTLYVADTVGNRITAIPRARAGMTSAGTGCGADLGRRASTTRWAWPSRRAATCSPSTAGTARSWRRHPGAARRSPPVPRHVGQPAGRGCAVRPGRRAARARRLLRGRREPTPADSALSSVAVHSAAQNLAAGYRQPESSVRAAPGASGPAPGAARRARYPCPAIGPTRCPPRHAG